MTRIIPKPATRGSQKWLQIAVNEKPSILDLAIIKQLPETKDQTITWISPIASDEYAEYRDNDFLERLGVKLQKRSLSSFWSHGGPQWDGLAKTHNGNVLLIEAKAHISEMKSPASLASTLSLRLIRQSLNEVKAFLDIDSSTDWAGTYYQYTNRIAHLYLLRELNQIPAYLIFLCFLNDKDMKGPKRIEEWQTEIHNLESYLSLPSKHKLSDYILHVYLDITQLQQG